MYSRLLIPADQPPQPGPVQTEIAPIPFKKSNISGMKSTTKTLSSRMRSSYHLGFGTLTIGHNPSHSDEGGDTAVARFAFASWFLDWAITITSRKQNGILNISLQPQCLVKDNSPIFLACALGNQQAVADLIAAGKASPLDATLNGMSPLTVSI